VIPVGCIQDREARLLESVHDRAWSTVAALCQHSHQARHTVGLGNAKIAEERYRNVPLLSNRFRALLPPWN